MVINKVVILGHICSGIYFFPNTHVCYLCSTILR
uniref:Uncharacterized protein n=1 Tax=Arundo donax TaxID=35708 RepID=A0A0A9F1V2_ARUDO